MKTNIFITFIVGLAIGSLLTFFINQKNNDAEMYSGMDTALMMNHNMMNMDHSMMDTETDMDTMMMDMTARMRGKTGDELDRIFLEDMIPHHQGAVDMAMILKAGTERPELQKMADDIITAQEAEIAMMKQWLQDWFELEYTEKDA